ncbi:hypothetical protein MTR_4g046090 [Medicago truncatula]|uniref:Myb-like domain-containing protein n=1 Tax=Medicago truncatula TaxID=3880 RepID=A0A072UUR7_MEDTR|nr:hypothetical protein MTR_4g046090 [Medicago truncatula]
MLSHWRRLLNIREEERGDERIKYVEYLTAGDTWRDAVRQAGRVRYTRRQGAWLAGYAEREEILDKKSDTCVVGRNQTSEAYWGKIAEYCNEHCSFDSPRDVVACRNRYNNMSKLINKWVGAYDGAKRMQGSGWSEDDVMAKAQELYACGKNVQFTLKEEWRALRDQPRYGSQMGGNVDSGSSGSKRSYEDSVGSSARSMGREAAKKKGKKKSKDETLEKKNKLLQEKTEAKKMKMYLKLSSEEHLDDRKKELLGKLERELFGN